MAQAQPGGRVWSRPARWPWKGGTNGSPALPALLVGARAGAEARGAGRSTRERGPAAARPEGAARRSRTAWRPPPQRGPRPSAKRPRERTPAPERGLARLARPDPWAAGMDSARSPCEYRALPPAAFVCAPRHRSPLPARPGPASFVEPALIRCFPLPRASLSPPQPPVGQRSRVAPGLALTPFSSLCSPSVAPVGPLGHLAGRPSWSPRDSPNQAVFVAWG